MARILVVGGTGTVGSAVVSQLLNDEHEVRVLTRDPDNAAAKLGDKVEIMEGDVTIPRNVEDAMFNIEVVFSSLSSPPGKKNITDIEYGGNLVLLEASKHQRVKRFLYVSVMNAEYFAGYPRFFVKYKVEEELKISGLPYTFFRPTIFMETLPRFINKGKAIVYGNQPHPIHFLAVADLAKVVAESLKRKESMNAVFDVMGPEPMTFDDALGMFKRYRRPKMKIEHSSLLWGRALGYVYMKKQPELAELVTLMNECETTPEKGDPSLTQTLFGPPATRLHDWLLDY
ncbi:hypothetical protein AMJ86_05010 [bacterium SM23_57]|nr:MAG: hypothetical protein AMJ86_05010 [bacterium SM23_57]